MPDRDERTGLTEDHPLGRAGAVAVEPDDLTSVVDAAYGAYFTGDVEGAVARCAEDAQWHAVTPVPDAEWNGSHPIRRYWGEILPGAVGKLADYAPLDMHREVRPPFVVSHLRSTHGAGLMIFRVVDGLITDIWVINAAGRGATGYF